MNDIEEKKLQILSENGLDESYLKYDESSKKSHPHHMPCVLYYILDQKYISTLETEHKSCNLSVSLVLPVTDFLSTLDDFNCSFSNIYTLNPTQMEEVEKFGQKN